MWFVGFTGLREQREAILHRMADRIIHRGPDMEGYHISGTTPAAPSRWASAVGASSTWPQANSPCT